MPPTACRGDGPSPARRPARPFEPNLSLDDALDLAVAMTVPADADLPDEGEGPPLIALAVDPVDAHAWPAWTDEVAWVAAEDLEEYDPAMPLFRRRAGEGGVN